MTLRDIQAECVRHESRMDGSHQRMDKLSSEENPGTESFAQPESGQTKPYQPPPGGPRPTMVLLAVAIVASIIFISVLVFIFVQEDRTPTGVFKEYIDAKNDQDGKRMLDQTVTRFADDYEQMLDAYAAVELNHHPQTEIEVVYVTYQDEMLMDDMLAAYVAVAEIELLYSVEVDDFCIVDYITHVNLTDIDQEYTDINDVVCVWIDGRWYLGFMFFY